MSRKVREIRTRSVDRGLAKVLLKGVRPRGTQVADIDAAKRKPGGDGALVLPGLKAISEVICPPPKGSPAIIGLTELENLLGPALESGAQKLTRKLNRVLVVPVRVHSRAQLT